MIFEDFEKVPVAEDSTTQEGAKEHLPWNAEEAHERAQEIARQGNYVHIAETLREEGLFAQEEEATKREYGPRLNESWINERDWEMLTILGLYDRTTLRHCIGTYEIAKQKIEAPLVGVNGERIILREHIEEEGVSVEQFLRSCLLHDIGKVEVPHCVIGNALSEQEWETKICAAVHGNNKATILEKIGLAPDGEYDNATVLAHLHEKGIRPITILGAEDVLSSEDLASALRMGFSGSDTLATIIERHEEGSADILTHHCCAIEAELAGHHHNYKGEELKYQLSTGALQAGVISAGGSIIDILHAADVEESLSSSERSYKGAFTPLHTLEELVMHARRGHLSPDIAYMWIENELSQIDLPAIDARAEEGDTIAQEDKKYLDIIRTFIEETRRSPTHTES